MCKLDFEWHDSRNGGEYRAEAGGFIVKAIRDESAESPWEAWDGQPPLIVYYDRSLDEKGNVLLRALWARHDPDGKESANGRR